MAKVLMYRSIMLEKPVRRAFLLVGVLVGLVLGVPGGAWALTYSFTTIDVPQSTATHAFGINGQGQIVGYFVDATGAHGFVLSGGSFTPFDVPGTNIMLTVGQGINTGGDIVGHVRESGVDRGFLKIGSSFTFIDVPGRATYPFGINDARQISGTFLDGASQPHAFLYSGGSFAIIDVPGSMFTDGYGVNNAGHIVGAFNDGNTYHGFIYNGGTFTTIDVPDSTYTSAFGINGAGEIVGNFYTAPTSAQAHGFVYSGGTFTTIDPPGSFYTEPRAINAAGQIVGYFHDATGTHGFLATPTQANRCPLGQSFWKNHPDAWPVTSLTLGSQTYTQAQLLTLLATPVRGDASLILADQLIAAKLNIANGSNPAPISSTITDADNLLSQFGSNRLPYNVRTSSAIGQQMVNDANVLDRYNNGDLTPDCQP
jgi:probable HAF family extracellular repeat protein